MDKKTLIALAAFIGLGGLAYFVLNQPQKAERVGKKKKPLPVITKGSYDSIAITGSGRSLLLKKKDTQWKIVKPIHYLADDYAVEAVMNKLEKLDFGDLVSKRKDRFSHFGLDEKQAIHIVLSHKKETIADFYLGKHIEGFTMFRRAQKEEVWQAIGALRSTFDKALRLWRNRKILALKPDKITSLTFSKGEQKLLTHRKDDKSPWQIVNSPKPFETLDQTYLSATLSTLTSFVSDDFADHTQPQAAGFDPPAGKLDIKTASKSYALEFGKIKGKDKRFVRLVGNPQIYLVNIHTTNKVFASLLDLKDKTIFNFDPKNVIEYSVIQYPTAAPKELQQHSAANLLKAEDVILRKKGSDWFGRRIKGNKEKKLNSQIKLKQALKTLSKLKAKAFSTQSIDALGLKKPGWKISLRFQNKKTPALSFIVGSESENFARALKVDGREDIYLVAKYALDQILISPKAHR